MNIRNLGTYTKQLTARLTKINRKSKTIVITTVIIVTLSVIAGLLVASKLNHDKFLAFQKQQESKLDDKNLTLAVNSMLVKKQYVQALDLINQKAKYPNDKQVLLLKGDISVAQGNLKEGLLNYKLINQKYGSDTDALLNIAQIELRLGQKKQALADYKLAASKLQKTPTLDAQTSLKNLQQLITELQK